MNLVLRPTVGAYLALLSSLYPGYDPVNVPVAIILGTLYSLLAGAMAGLLSAGVIISCLRRTKLHSIQFAVPFSRAWSRGEQFFATC